MESDDKKFGDDETASLRLETPDLKRNSETRRSEAKITGSMARLSDKSLIVEASESRKTQGRSSDGARVVFVEPEWTYTDEKLKSGMALIEKSRSTGEEKLRDEDTTRVSLDEIAIEESIKRSAAGYARSIGRMSRVEADGEPLEVESYDALKEIEARTKKQLASQVELSRPPSGPLKGDDPTKFKDRGIARPSSGFLGYTIEGMLTQYPSVPRPRIVQMYHPDEAESTLPTTTETSAATSGTRMRFSDNVGVYSMLFDAPQTDCLPPMEATAFAVVLQEAIDFLEILKNVIPARVDERWDERYRTIDEMYGRPEEPMIMFREEMGLLPLVPTVSEKIQRERTYMHDIIKGTARDIQCLRRYDVLEVEVDDIVRILEGEHNLEVNHEIWMGQVEQLKKLIESDGIENDEEARNLFVSTQQMNSEVDNSIFLNGSKLGYVERWEEARLDQQKLRLEIKEQKFNDALGDCEKMERADRIISGEVRSFLQGNTRDLEEDIVAWTSRYNGEIERLQQEINDTKEKIELQKLDIQNLRELRDERQIFVDECNDEKERLEREAEYQEAVNEAATIIQTLWRGFMVRHELGQYRNLWTLLRKRKKRAAALRKKREDWEKKKAAEWGATDLKKLKNVLDPNA